MGMIGFALTTADNRRIRSHGRGTPDARPPRASPGLPDPPGLSGVLTLSSSRVENRRPDRTSLGVS
jgi:hypothetical protein